MVVEDFIRRLSRRLRRSRDGIWIADSAEQVSYPDDARAGYAAVEDGSFWFAHRNRCIVSVVRRFPPAGMILDVGGGNGFVSLGLAKAGLPSIVMEPGAQGAEIAHARGLPVILSTFAAARVSDQSLPAVGLFDVLEHIESDGEMLVDIHRALKPGGWLYLTVPAYGWLWSDEDSAAGHVRRYGRRSLTRQLTAAGFRVRYATCMFGPLVPAILLLRAVPSRLRRRRAAARTLAADHTLPAGLAGRLVAAALDAEHARIARGGSVGLGSSILVAAQRPSEAAP
jgi:2-polyprenyl-3-methyl-5-hydroxy-6-metoxy-1,4-benzoquinol methylase